MNLAASYSPPLHRSGHHLGEGQEVLVPFAAAEVDAEPDRIERGIGDPAVGDACLAAPGGKLGMSSAIFPNSPRIHRCR
jgi:hypothetical protein